MTLGEMLVQARGLRSRAEVAVDLGVSEVTVGRWERDERVPETPILERLLTSYGVPRRLWADAIEAVTATAQGRAAGESER